MYADLTGKLLIALPSIGDERFERSVILLCAHSEDYAMGIVLNKPMIGLKLGQLLDQLEVPVDVTLPNTFVLDGGPVSSDRGFVIHTDDVVCEGATLDIGGEMCMTATLDMLHAIGSKSGPRQSVLALGYSGWGAGQLEDELAGNAWLVGQADSELVFGHAHEDKWEVALQRIGIDSGRLQIDPGTA